MDVKLEREMRKMETRLTAMETRLVTEREQHEREIAAVKIEMSEIDKRHERELAEQKEEMQCKMAELKVSITSSTLSLCCDHTPSG